MEGAGGSKYFDWKRGWMTVIKMIVDDCGCAGDELMSDKVYS